MPATARKRSLARLQFDQLENRLVLIPFAIGERVDGTILQLGEADAFTFHGSPGQRLYFDGISGFPLGTAMLPSPSGARLFELDPTWDSNTLTVTEPGTYQLRIAGEYGSTGAYAFRLLDLADAPVVVFDATVSGTFVPHESNLYQFRGAAGMQLNLEWLTRFPPNGGDWTLYGPGNQEISGGMNGTDRGLTLHGEGVYAIEVGNASTGLPIDYQFSLRDMRT